MSNHPMVTTDFRALCAKVIAYNEGQGEYNFTNLKSHERDNADFDAWVDLRDEIKSALADTANDRLIGSKLAVAQPPPALEPVAWCRSDDFNDAAKNVNPFLGGENNLPTATWPFTFTQLQLRMINHDIRGTRISS